MINKQEGNSLNQIMHGAVIAMFGIVTGLVLQFGARILIARYFSNDYYGIYSLAIAVLNIVIVVTTLGFQDTIPRYISHFKTRNEFASIKQSIDAGIRLTAITGIFLSIVLFIASAFISNSLFHTNELELPLKIIAVSVPFLTMIYILTSVFRGYGNIMPHAIFQLFCINAIFVVLLLLISFLGLPFIYVLYAFTSAAFISFAGLLILFFRQMKQWPTTNEARISQGFISGMFKFSLPLMGVSLLTVLMTWSDTMFIGFFKSATDVGLYNAASPIAQFIYHPLSAWQLIYIPVATRLFSQGNFEEFKRNYVIVTKWIVSSTLPIFLVVFFFPEAVISLFFGPQYLEASLPLRILSAGFIFNNFFGLRGVSLIALGDSRFIFWSNLVAAVVCIALNLILIPAFGITGAAIATSASLIVSSLLMAARVHHICGAQPFSLNLIKPVVVSILLTVILKFIAGSLAFISWWILALLFILYCLLYGVAILLTRSFDKEDIAILLDIEKASGINAEPLKKLLRPFM